MLCKYFFRRNVLVKQNKHQQREQEIELVVREIANRVVKEDFALGRYCGDPSIKEEILACLQKNMESAISRWKMMYHCIF